MLKELFILRNGSPSFYYAEGRTIHELSDEEINKSMLSSGLFSAITMFSEETRESAIKSFNSENELFLFTKTTNSNCSLVGVFPIDTQQNLATLILDKIKFEIDQNNIFGSSHPADLLSEENKILYAKIPNLINSLSISADLQEFYDNEITKTKGAFLGFSIDKANKNLIWKFARPLPLFKDNLVKDTLLVFRVANNFLNKTNLGNEVSTIIIQNDKKITGFYDNNENIVSISSNFENEINLLNQTIKMGLVNGIQTIYPNFHKSVPKAKYLFQNNEIKYVTGDELLDNTSKVFIMTFFNNITKLYELIHHKIVGEILVIYRKNVINQHIRIRFENSIDFCSIEIFE